MSIGYFDYREEEKIFTLFNRKDFEQSYFPGALISSNGMEYFKHSKLMSVFKCEGTQLWACTTEGSCRLNSPPWSRLSSTAGRTFSPPEANWCGVRPPQGWPCPQPPRLPAFSRSPLLALVNDNHRMFLLPALTEKNAAQ